MNNKSKNISFISIILVIVIIITLFVGISDHRKNVMFKSSSNGLRTEIQNTNKRTKHLNRNRAINYFKAKSPDLNIIEKTNNKRIKQAFYLSCTKLHNWNNHSKYYKEIKYDLGNQAGNALINDTKPIKAAQGSTILQAQKYYGVKYGFGRYNGITNVLPVTIMAKYRTSPFINGSGNTHGMKPKTQTYDDIFKMNIHIMKANKSYLTLVNHGRSQNNQDD